MRLYIQNCKPSIKVDTNTSQYFVHLDYAHRTLKFLYGQRVSQALLVNKCNLHKTSTSAQVDAKINLNANQNESSAITIKRKLENNFRPKDARVSVISRITNLTSVHPLV